MKVFNHIFLGLSFLSMGCERPSVSIHGLTFPGSPPPSHDSGPSAPEETNSGWIESTNMDDGFGASVAYGDQQIWIGAPFGNEGMVYRWVTSNAEVVLTGPGKLGSHLAWTEQGLWIAAPLHNGGAGAIFLIDGTVGYAGEPSTGIALTGDAAGAFAWESGWTGADGTSENSSGRPTSLSIDPSGKVAVGMAHGPDFLFVHGRTLSRLSNGDEAGFSVGSADIDQDGVPDWIVGAPGTNQVVAYDGTTLEPVRTWSGTGRFGHAMAICANEQGTKQLVIGAPLASDTGTVFIFADFSEEASDTWTGKTAGAQLGTSLGCMPGGFLAGAPGLTEEPAAVLWARFGA